MSTDALGTAEMDRLGRVLLAAAPEAIVFADAEGIIRFWNLGAERMFGFTAAEAVGQSLDIIIPEPQRARHWAGFRHVMAMGESRYGHGDLLAVPGLRKEGSIRKSGVTRMIDCQQLGHSPFFGLPRREHPRLPDALRSQPEIDSRRSGSIGCWPHAQK